MTGPIVRTFAGTGGSIVLVAFLLRLLFDLGSLLDFLDGVFGGRGDTGAAVFGVFAGWGDGG